MVWVLVILTAVLGLYMAWSIGANDVANSMGCAVGSRSITIKRAIIAAGICDFAGAVLVGSHVTQTVRNGIVSTDALRAIPGASEAEVAALLVLGMASALLAAALCVHVATWWGMPVSTTHAIVASVEGFGVVAAGWRAVYWSKMVDIVASWFISPVVGGVLAFVFFKLISRFILRKEKPFVAARRHTPIVAFATAVVVTLATLYNGLGNIIKDVSWLTGPVAIGLSVTTGLIVALVSRRLFVRAWSQDGSAPLGDQLERVERMFAPLVIATSCSVAFAHGANDVANAVGPLAAVVHIVTTGTIQMRVPVPLWILVLGGVGIVVGLATFGYRVLYTVGEKITQITPSRAVAASLATSITVLVCSKMGLPVSTSHTVVGAVLGIGLARGLGAVNRDVTREIFGSWLVTLPVSAVLSLVLFLLGRAFLLGPLTRHIAALGG